MSADLDFAAVRAAFAHLYEVADWVELTRARLDALCRQAQTEAAETTAWRREHDPEDAEDVPWIELSVDQVRQLGAGLDTAAANIRGAVAVILGRSPAPEARP